MSSPTNADADAGAGDAGPAGPSAIFVYDNGDPIEFWVHPSYPSRSDFVTLIKAHGGVVTHDFEMAHFAVVSKAMSDKQLEIVKRPNSTTTAISGAWINGSIKNGAQMDQDDFLIRKLRTIDTSDRPVTTSENPSPSTRAQDEHYFLWACEKLFNDNTLIQWIEIYRWCANDTQCRSESYWSALNAPGSVTRSKAQRIYRSVVANAIGSDTSMQAAATEITEAAVPPSQAPLNVSSKRRPLPYSETEHRALIEYFASDPVGTKVQIWERFHQMHPNRSAAAWREHARHFEGFFWEQARRLKAGLSYELSPAYYRPNGVSKSGPAEETHNDDQDQDEPLSRESDSPHDGLAAEDDRLDAADDGPDNNQPSLATSGRFLKIRYSSEERRDLVAHLAKYPNTSWENYTSKYTPRTRSSLLTFHKRHPSLDREAAELNTGRSNIRAPRPLKRLQPLDSSPVRAASPKRPRVSDPGTYRAIGPSDRVSPSTSMTALEVSASQSRPSSTPHHSRPSPGTPGAQSQTQRKKFDGEDWKLAMQFVLSRDPPEDPLENVLSWKAFAKTHTTLDLDGWMELYYSDLSLFKSMEAHRA